MPETPMEMPAKYFPLERGLYEVAPGLRTFGTDFGNGEADRKIFQFDADFSKYRESKLAARAERLTKYLQTHELPIEVESHSLRFIAERLAQESPRYFSFLSTGTESVLECRLTNERLRFDESMNLVGVEGGPAVPYANAFDAIASQLQEDLALTVSRDGRDWLAALHLCSPSHWAAEDKIGRNFFAVHAPVPGIEKINRAAASFVDAMIHKGPYVRFVWGFGTDQRLNHHPEPAPGADAAEWKGRAFQRRTDGASPFHLRVERQVTWGFPTMNAALFTIRVSFIDGLEIKRDPARRALLISALESMSPESLHYKGLAADRDAVIEWLASP